MEAPALRRLFSDELSRDLRCSLRLLLDDAFDGDFSDDDRDHALGGTHLLADIGGMLVGHASVVPRRVTMARRELSCGYVEAVAVGASARRRGLGVALMAAVDVLVSDHEHSGWVTWRGRLAVRSAGGDVVETQDGRGSVMVHGDEWVIASAHDETPTMAIDDRPGDPW
ncbi:GNAT family N-acetyltransferase [Williamsia deligens]|uniref:GNAT family N-acetyltransferase n=1 Tax=Williamsia deligens TaxID=321325 RepID=A0ABW3GBN3_9NOCA|nr:GNAT family N-acetyltransferase [Williamsia deligens]MCP2195823.1 aminoglycoside 2'-N-acetyltransferase I [Williamsia deligens]